MTWARRGVTIPTELHHKCFLAPIQNEVNKVQGNLNLSVPFPIEGVDVGIDRVNLQELLS
jgi:hypothetical protein